MKNTLRRVVCALVVAAVFGAMAAAWGEEETVPSTGRIYVSFLWAGKSDADCMLRDTLVADSSEECEKEFTRAEDEIKTLVNRRNEKGAGWKWGVFAKCAPFDDTNSYNDNLEKYRKRCMGK